jgi:hypothetical protein
MVPASAEEAVCASRRAVAIVRAEVPARDGAGGESEGVLVSAAALRRLVKRQAEPGIPNSLRARAFPYAETERRQPPRETHSAPATVTCSGHRG